MPTPRRIGVNALYLIPGGVGGTEVYLRNLLQALAQIDSRNQYFVFVNRETGDDLCPAAPNFTLVRSSVSARLRPARLVWEQTVLPLQTARLRLDVLFSPGFSSPMVCRGRKVTVIHDLQHKRQPENFGFLERKAWDAMVWSSVQFSDALVAVSETSRQDLIDVYRADPARIHVVHHGVEPAFFDIADAREHDPTLLSQTGLPDCRYLLAVSTIHPHKNWLRLLEAYVSLVKDGRDEHLVVAGLAGKASGDVAVRLQDPQLASRVHLLGWQPRSILVALFQSAEALVFPSTFEGFGMPVLEAMAAGVPVACSDIPPLREVAGDAALFFDPYSPERIADGIRRVLDEPDLRGSMIARGKERAARSTWRRAAERTLAVLLQEARP